MIIINNQTQQGFFTYEGTSANAEGLKGKEDADLQAEINKVVNPYLDHDMNVTAISKATIDELLKQSDLKADDIAVIYQHMYNTKS